MKILVEVKAGVRVEKVEKWGENSFKVSVKEPAKDGKANSATIKLLARYLGVSSSAIQIISGRTSRKKVLTIHF